MDGEADEPPPEWPPDPLPGTDEYLRAFTELSGDRISSATPYSAIDRWAQRNGVTDPDEFALLVEMISAMDMALSGTEGQGSTASRPLSPELFDAVFG